MRKDQVQQISEQIQKRTINIGRVKPKYTKFIMPAGRIVPEDQHTNLDIVWSKWWFVPTDLFTGNHIGPDTFSEWIEENPDMHYGSIDNDKGNIYDGPVVYNAHIYYALEVKVEIPQTLTIEIDTACKINILIDNRSEVVGSKPGGFVHTTTIPGGTWVPIEVYIHNPYQADDLLNQISIEMNLRDTVDSVRSQIPLPPFNFVASYGDYTDHIELSWDLNRDISDLDKVQIWRSPTMDGEYVPIGSIDANLAAYTDTNVYQGEMYYYKARFVTAEGGISVFSTVAIGLVGEIGGIITAEFSPNAIINNQYTVGNYSSNEELTVTFRSSVAVFEDSIIVELEYPTTGGLGYYKIPIGTDGLATYTGSNTWTVTVDLSSIEDEDYPLTQGRAKIISKAYIPGIAPDGWMGPQGTAGVIVTAHGFNIDDQNPILDFFIDYDRQFASEDTFTYSNNVALMINSIIDPNTNSRPYHNPSGDEYELNYIDGEKYVAGVYQIRWHNDEETLTGLIGENPITPWIDYASVGNIIDPHYLDMINQGDTKTVYMQIRDKVGNKSSVVSDTIIYLDSLPTVVSVVVDSHYDYLDISWRALDGNVDGYYLYRNTSGIEPAAGVTPHAIIGPDYGGELITQYKDRYPEINATDTYYYWIKGYLGEGTNPENHIISANYSIVANGALRTDAPSADTVVSAIGQREAIHIQFGVPIGDDAEQAATEHLIYRTDNVSTPTIDNSELIQTMGFVETGNIFNIYDSSAVVSTAYKYVSVAKNGPWLDGSVYYMQIDTLNWTTTVSITDAPPQKATWACGQISAGPWGVNLVWNNNKNFWADDDDVLGYTLFMANGALPFGDAEPIIHVSCPDVDEPLVHYTVYAEALPEPINNFWVVAYDTRQSGELSDMLTTGLVALYPNTPEWVSGECFAEFGWNQLAWKGGGDDYGYQYGFNIYRAMYNVNTPPNSNDLSYATGEYGASLIHTFVDPRSDPGWKNVMVDTIEASGWGMEYCYWITAINQYNYESSAVLLTGLEMTKPNYEAFFINSLDNGSFERDFQMGTWEILEPDSCFLVTTGQHSCRPGYAGYICTHGPWGDTTVHFKSSSVQDGSYSQLKYQYVFIQPNTDYCLNYYMYRTDNWTFADSFGIYIDWYDISGGSIESTGYKYGNVDLNEEVWTRKHFFATAPSDASYASLRFGFRVATRHDYCHIDAVQFEISGTDSPGRFTDSRNISADKILAHSIVADMIKAGSIRADLIGAEEISSYHIRAHSIDLDRLTTVPSTPRVRFNIDPVYPDNDYHYLQLDLVEDPGVRKISPDGITWYNCVWDTANLPPDSWSFFGDYTLCGPNNANTYYVYITGWPATETDPAHIKLSAANTYPGDAENGAIIARAVNTLEGGEEGFPGYFSVMEWSGPGVTINGNQITAGSINGLLVQSETISGRQIMALSISGNHIVSDTLETRHLQAKSITTDKLVVRAADSNLFCNPHWEMIDASGQDFDSNYNWHNPYSASNPGRSHDIDRWLIASGYTNGAYLWKPDSANVPGEGARLSLRYNTLPNTLNMKDHGIWYWSRHSRDQLYLDPNKTYTFSMMCKLHSASSTPTRPKLSLHGKDEVWRSNYSKWKMIDHIGYAPHVYTWNNYADDNGWVTVYLVFGKQDGLSDPAVWVPENWDNGNFEQCIFALNTAFHNMTLDMTFANFTLTEGRRVPIPYERSNYASTKIDGTQISTGKIFAELVNIEDSTGEVKIDGTGIKVGSSEGDQYTKLNERTLRYFDDGYVTKYGQRQEFQHIADESYGSTWLSRLFYYKQLRQHPQFTIIDNGYLTNSASCGTVVRDVEKRPIWTMPMMYQAAIGGGAPTMKINTLYGTMIGKFFYAGGTATYLETCYKKINIVDETDFYNHSSLHSYPYCGYVRTGDYNPGQYKDVGTPTYIYSNTFDDWITWNRPWDSADAISGVKLTTNFCVTVHGPCTGWKFHWSLSLIAQNDTTLPPPGSAYGLEQYQIRETRSGWDSITLNDNEIYTLTLPQQTFNLSTWYEDSWYMPRDSYALQFRVWTINENQSVRASGSIFGKSNTMPYVWGKPALTIEKMYAPEMVDSQALEEASHWTTDVIINEV